ncbi:hypothetical protein [Corynebacterium casei]|uniref:hypothetical protein n=2 Tax=Corynebacterium casei TaxID=160386 RepID=UPI0018662D57|nr:hypothetical protein [Corynebacterium casei]MDN5800429.1 hypothetical protein [Corynebacterium casei]MDN5922400.1 hypothetical protein [Corynebacterium casei]MDN6341832.1 hypothetical protein [Corynebacterium casei]
MMRKLLAGLITLTVFLSGCSAPENTATEVATTTSELPTVSEVPEYNEEPSVEPSFTSFGDADHLQYVEDQVLASVESELASDDYAIQDITASYVSQEYIDELAFNSQENIYFGYTRSEIEAQFQDTSYLFSLGSDGQTEVRARETYDDSFDRITRNVAIGAGVILVSVTISLLAAPAGASTAAVVFAVSAKTGAASAISSAALGGVVGGAVTAIETGDLNAALKDAAVAASEGLKWGAIAGAVGGGIGKAKTLPLPSGSNPKVPTARDSERYALWKYGGTEQKTYLNGKEVPRGGAGSVRPDVVFKKGNREVAVEVKNYNLEQNFNSLRVTLRNQIAYRKLQLPEGMSQMILLDVRGRGYSSAFLKPRIEMLKREFPDVAIDVIRA